MTGAEGKALHKPDVCEARNAKQKLLNKAKLNTSVQQTLWEPREQHCTNPVFVRQTKQNINSVLTTKACSKLREQKGKH